MTLRYRYDRLNTLQKGAFGEAFAKLGFLLEGFEIFSADCDDRGTDFVAKSSSGIYYDVQVKTTGITVNPFIYQSKFRIEPNFIFAAVRLCDNQEPSLYLARGTEWDNPYGCISFNAAGGNAGPYYEIKFSKKHQEHLTNFEFNKYILQLL